jgi:hypothetical protein
MQGARLALVEGPERAMIGNRTREALARAKVRGVKLGGPELAEARKVVQILEIAP